ncbi:TIR domain-containing protein [Nitrosomonas nitrosa]|uniref:toll/interleukin-1 receptor domain-containing protein n=1 Tax=Nitrosomonas nitrosa TaxID=52442 RepID=UPI000D30D6D8|nr:toll/interleukin-1 receptor domain-containing protein [Nitrosomonas nitrosa]PTQ92610.1 TIR domain-containing protein [Nitrosomonas nitrosa]
MFITVQYPILDYRFFQSSPARTERPKWPEPSAKEVVRYFGPVMSRNAIVYGPWDSEQKYCDVHGVLNLCGMGESHFFHLLHQSPYQSRILFRRFQSDGRFSVKFDIGFNDRFEEEITKTADALDKEQFYRHISRYLLCPLRVKVGGKLSPYLPLIDAGKHLRNAYFWSTYNGAPKSFNPRDLNYQVEDCEPQIIIQIESHALNLKFFEEQKVEMPELAAEGVHLYFDYMPYQQNGSKYETKLWIITSDDSKNKLPVLSKDFKNYSSPIRYLRKNLLKIHQEKNAVKKLLEVLSGNDSRDIDATGKEKIFYYLHKKLLNLSKVHRNAQPQYKLVELAFKLTEACHGTESLIDQLQGVNEYLAWMEKTNVPEKQPIVDYLNRNKTLIDEFIRGGTVFISYNHADALIVNDLARRLKETGITVILDSQAMLAGAEIKSFITKSILSSQAIISIVSASSLLSGWVGMETINTLAYKEFFPNTQFIPCNIDNEFFDDNFVANSVTKIQSRIDEIDGIIAVQNKQGIDSLNFNEEKTRLHYLKSNLSNIVGHLKGGLCIDISSGNLAINFPKIVEAIRA